MKVRLVVKIARNTNLNHPSVIQFELEEARVVAFDYHGIFDLATEK